jgi:predicted enzyme related to lactoylglutathione lyase
MIDGIRCASVPVPRLGEAAAWYARALEVQPYLASGEAVTFYLNGFLLTLRTGAVQAGGTVVYWSVDDLAAELERLAALGARPCEPISALDAMTRQAALRDPFGNVFGLVERKDPAERQARSHRAAEKIALREIRTVLDDLGASEQQERRFRRLMWTLVAACVVIGGALLWLMLPDVEARRGDLLERQAPTLRRP